MMKRTWFAEVRLQTFAMAWRPTARSIQWRAPIGAAALAVLIIVQQRIARPTADAGTLTPRVQLIAAIIAAAAATTLEDPAERLVETSPTTAVWRAGLRLNHAICASTATWVVTLLLAATAPGGLEVADLTIQAGALLSLAVGVAAMWGSGAGSAAVAVVVLSAILLPERWSLLDGTTAANGRIGLIGLVGVAALASATRDPAARRVRSTDSVNSRAELT